MDPMRFEVKVVRGEGVPVDAVRVREYGAVRVTAEWPADRTAREFVLSIEVHGVAGRHDAPAYVELFLHDVFLLLNLAAPGSFGGTLSASGSDVRVREVNFRPHVFEHAAGVGRLPLEQVTRWYDTLGIGTRQIAMSAEAIALFELLKLAGAEEDEEVSILRLARAADALLGRPEPLQRLFELRDDLALGRTPVFHPMHDDALDPWVEDATRKWIEVADDAAGAVVGALQERIRNTTP